MMEQIIIPDIIAAAVTKAAAKSGIDIMFYHGTPEEIEATLIEITNVQTVANGIKKFPAVFLFHDFPIKRGGEYYGTVTLPKLVIATNTRPEFKSDKRYTETFKPVLYPIYYALLQAMTNNANIVETDPNNFNHTAIDRMYWGTQTAGTALSDYLDAIEIKDLRLTIQQNCN